jgi:hypothetical protein
MGKKNLKGYGLKDRSLFKALSQHLPGQNKVNYEKRQDMQNLNTTIHSVTHTDNHFGSVTPMA